MRIALGSTNQVKIDAAREAFSHFYENVTVISVGIENLQSQPVTLHGTVKGALTRARKSMEKINNADLGVGVEAGLMEIAELKTYLNIQFAVILDRNDRLTVGCSSGFQLPSEVAKMVLIERMEVDRAVEFLYNIKDIGEKRGLIDLMTKGAVSRKELIANALIMAIAPRIGERR